MLDYRKMWDYNPIKPLIIWKNTTDALDNYYNLPEVNLKDNTPENIDIKNTMRHITGSAILQQEYPNSLAFWLKNSKDKSIIPRFINNVKETGDYTRDLYFTKPFGTLSDYYWTDTAIDINNNQKGYNFALKNPNADMKSIMDYALSEAKNISK